MADGVKTFEEAQAEAWAIKVQGELDIVNQVLQEVAVECQESPYEDDVIFNTVMETGRAFGDAWSQLAKQFVDAVDGIHTVAKQVHETVGNVIDGIASFVTGKSY